MKKFGNIKKLLCSGYSQKWRNEKMIMLGNLTVEQFEKRCGITLTESERSKLNELREQTCDNVDGNNKIHIYDIPFMIYCGNSEARKTVIDMLTPYSGDMKTTLQIGGGV